MGLYGQRLVQDKNLNPPDDRKYVILVRLRGGEGHSDTRAESKPKHAVRAGQCRAEFLSNTPPLADENMKQPEACGGFLPEPASCWRRAIPQLDPGRQFVEQAESDWRQSQIE